MYEFEALHARRMRKTGAAKMVVMTLALGFGGGAIVGLNNVLLGRISALIQHLL